MGEEGGTSERERSGEKKGRKGEGCKEHGGREGNVWLGTERKRETKCVCDMKRKIGKLIGTEVWEARCLGKYTGKKERSEGYYRYLERS